MGQRDNHPTRTNGMRPSSQFPAHSLARGLFPGTKTHHAERLQFS